MHLAEYKSMSVGFRMALKARRSCVCQRILRLILAPEPLESPSSRAAVELCVLDHHIDAFAIAL
jgi:hypothetical protein